MLDAAGSRQKEVVVQAATDLAPKSTAYFSGQQSRQGV
jgi:hypothetical protein